MPAILWTFHGVECDTCGTVYGEEDFWESSQSAERQAKDCGWRFHGKEAVCPACLLKAADEDDDCQNCGGSGV